MESRNGFGDVVWGRICDILKSHTIHDYGTQETNKVTLETRNFYNCGNRTENNSTVQFSGKILYLSTINLKPKMFIGDRSGQSEF